MRRPAGEFLQGGAHGLGDQFQAGQVPHRGQDVGGVGALPAAFPDQADGPDFLQREAEQLVGPALLGQALSEVGKDAVMEAGVFQLHAQGVLEVDAVAHGLGGLPVGQLQQELQNRHGRQLGW